MEKFNIKALGQMLQTLILKFYWLSFNNNINMHSF